MAFIVNKGFLEFLDVLEHSKAIKMRKIAIFLSFFDSFLQLV